MRVSSLLALLVLTALSSGEAVAREAVREIRRTFAVQPGATLELDSYRGDIAIETGEAGEIGVSVDFDFDVETAGEADRLWRGFDCKFESAGSMVVITARNAAETGPRFSWRESSRMRVYYRITVPRQCDLKLKTGTGNIAVGRVAGRMSAQAGTGTIFFRQVDGSIDATTGSGDIVISRCSGAVTARASRGVIRAGTLGGPAELRNSGGGIEVLVARGALTAVADGGDVGVNFPRRVEHPASLTASGGSVRVAIDPAASCGVDASASWGRVRSTLSLEGEVTDRAGRRLAGRLNGGGPLLRIRANGGSVSLVPGEAPFD
jgi:hypothetical protein